MRFHEFGDKKNPLILLIHGVLTPWQMWEAQIEYLKKDYFVVVPALNGHVEEEASEYTSAESEAVEIAEYLLRNYGVNAYMVYGLSMGGVVANKLFESGKLQIKHLIFDGAPLVPMTRFAFLNTFAQMLMRKQYISIVRGAKKRDKNIIKNFVKYFMPERYLESFLNIADLLSEESIANMVKAACYGDIQTTVNAQDTKILFLHGTKLNEMIAKKSAKKLQKLYPNVGIRSFQGYKHGELAIYKPEEWFETVKAFIEDE